MKIGALIVALLAASAASSAVAKGTNDHHAHHAAAAKPARHGGGPGPHNGAPADSANDKRIGDRLDVDGATVPMPSRDGGRSVKLPKLQIVKPDAALTPRVGASNPWRPPARNAIGQAAVSSVNARAGGWQSDNRKAFQTEIRTPGQGGFGAASVAIAKPIMPPGANATIANRGKIDGAALIRPAVAAAIGGPSKPVGGINGTLMRPKHR